MKTDATEPTPRPVRAALDLGSACHAGRVRELNEDRFLLAPESGIFAVADGMGGHAGGEVASTAVVEALAAVGPAASAGDLLTALKARLAAANADIQKVARARGAVVGTTVAVLLIHAPHFACLWSGDSRIYRVRGGVLAQLSRDHTEIQSLVERGVITPQEAQTWPRRNVITRAIGVQAQPELDLDHGLLEAGDLFILCSDGLTRHVEDGEILAAASGPESGSAQGLCDALLALTLHRGAADNVTVVAVRYLGRPADAPADSPAASGPRPPEGPRA
ncbi:protein serine/threonine phosphatase [Methylobacterium sp. 4-46]|uniref:PP2C family protein-serine/threonine phosphatase n=1 Tax=unclassified Methylobacterium TaxID=2615210 RepID=UPI000165CA45|nr:MULTISPECIES: protein phosphatase 2C domain-containing protein [Methylobacterium]ACA15461.1 protein serine/threonine phosphatase [Methylobacterium sp. 4-46]WFT81178.1 protein phosphatase 2C domain-containing protein [Methylobacterium nodulans]